MATISAQSVKQLRERTGLPMMDCKKALVESAGDEEAAIELLRKKGADAAAKKSGRETSEGRIACFIAPDGSAGVVELRCETAPVANGDDFRQLASDLARQVAEGGAAADAKGLLAQKFVGDPGRTLQDRLLDVQNRIRENMQIARFQKLDGPTACYEHHNGRKAAVVQLAKPTGSELPREVGMQIVSMSPLALTVEQLDPEKVAKEREILTEQARSTGKPENVLAKIVDGRMGKFYAETVLLEQPFVKDDDKKKVGDVLKAAGIELRGFVRWEVGEE